MAAALGACGLAGCGGGHEEVAPQAKSNEPAIYPAAVLMVEPTNWPATVRTQGSLIADEVTIVGAKVAGRVNDLKFDLGDAVKAQAVLATLDQQDFKLQVSLSDAQLLQARAALGLAPEDPLESLDPQNAPPVREAKAMWDETRTRIARMRQLQLLARNTVTQDELDTAIAAEGAAEARHAAAINAVREKMALISVRSSELNVAQQHLADTVVHAPFDGLVQERHVAHGSFVQMGDPIATLVRTSVVRFRGTMPERYAHRLALGQHVRLKFEGVAHPRVARVTRISPTVEERSRSLAFEATLPNIDGATILRLLGPLDAAYSRSDANADGEVIEREFAEYLAAASQGTIDVELGGAVFRASDEDRDAALSFEELQAVSFPALRTGLFGEAEVIVDQASESLVIPRSALLEFAGTEKVWKVIDGVAKEQIIQTARQGERGVEVIRGLEAGNMILVDALKGRMGRIEPIFETAAQSPVANGSALAETQAGEEVEPSAEISTSAVNR